jgi:hypothetical protein
MVTLPPKFALWVLFTVAPKFARELEVLPDTGKLRIVAAAGFTKTAAEFKVCRVDVRLILGTGGVCLNSTIKSSRAISVRLRGLGLGFGGSGGGSTFGCGSSMGSQCCGHSPSTSTLPVPPIVG